MAPDSMACAQPRTGGLGSESSVSKAPAQVPAPDPACPRGGLCPAGPACIHLARLRSCALEPSRSSSLLEMPSWGPEPWALSGLTTGVLRDPWPSGPSGSSMDGSGEAFADPSSEGSLGALTPVAKPPPPQSRLLGAHGAAAPPQDWSPTPAKGETDPAMGSSWDPLTPVPCTSCPDRGCMIHRGAGGSSRFKPRLPYVRRPGDATWTPSRYQR